MGKIPWRRKWHPTLVFLPGEPYGQRILVGYSPWGCKGSDTTERLTLSFMWGLSSPTRDQTHTPCTGGQSSTTGTVGKSPALICFDFHFHLWSCLTRALPFHPLHFIYPAPFCFFSSLFIYHYYYFLFGYVLVVSCGIKLTRD